MEISITGTLFQLIMNNITSVTYQAIVNGELSRTFAPHCGLRQGDTLSPYIFVLCLEKLSHIIADRSPHNLWKPVKASRSGPLVSHLFPADGLLLTEASMTQIHTLKTCLDDFCMLSGQKVNYEKSRLYCSPNNDPLLASDIATISGSPLCTDLGTYLGVPHVHSHITPFMYHYVVDKVQERLSSWKQRSLSMAGKITYVKSVMNAIPVCIMQTILLPMSICKRLDQLM